MYTHILNFFILIICFVLLSDIEFYPIRLPGWRYALGMTIILLGVGVLYWAGVTKGREDTIKIVKEVFGRDDIEL